MIRIVREDKKATFGDFGVGTLFFAVYNDVPDYETIWLKITPVIEVPDETSEKLNAAVVVGNETGSVLQFEDNEEIIPIYNGRNQKVIIRAAN